MSSDNITGKKRSAAEAESPRVRRHVDSSAGSGTDDGDDLDLNGSPVSDVHHTGAPSAAMSGAAAGAVSDQPFLQGESAESLLGIPYSATGAAQFAKLMSHTVTCKPTSIQLQGVPWARLGGYGDGPLVDRLTMEILDFCAYVTPTAQERERRADCVMRVRKVAQELWPHCKVAVFGSFDTGLFLPVSDIDITVIDTRSPDPLHTLARALRRAGLAGAMQLIKHARVPIIKFRELETGLLVDVSFDVSNGPANTAIVKRFAASYPLLRPLILVLKTVLRLRGLNETFTGGVGSYLLTNLVISHMQHRIGARAVPLGAALLDFLELYGSRFNLLEAGISIADGGRYFSKRGTDWCDPSRPALFTVIDPQNPASDLGRNSYQALRVRTEFARALECVRTFRPWPPHNGIEVHTPLAAILWGAPESELHQEWCRSEFVWRFRSGEKRPRGRGGGAPGGVAARGGRGGSVRGRGRGGGPARA